MNGKGTLDYFSKQMLVMRICGLSLKENESLSYKIYSKSLIWITIALPGCLGFREIYVQGVEAYLDYILYQFGYFVIFLKALVVYRNRKQLRKILEKLQDKPFTPNFHRGGDFEKKSIDQCVWITTVQGWVYLAIAVSSVGVNIIYTVIGRIRSNDYHDWSFSYGKLTVLDITTSPSYEITALFQLWTALYCAIYLAITDILIATLLAHISYQFKILQNYLRQLVKNVQVDTEFKNTSDIPWQILHKALVDFLKHHLAVIDIAKELEDIIYILVLLVYLSSVGLLCFNVYLLLIGRNLAKTAQTCVEMGAYLGQIGIISFWGEKVILESGGVANAAYETDFVGTDNRFQKALQLIMVRSQREIKLSAGKFKYIQLLTFTWVLKASYSAFMLLKSTQK